MNQKDTVVVSIDFQERLVPAMVDSKPMIDKAVKLLKGANILGIPVLFTQQYTRGLGDTVPEIKDVCPEFSYIEKQSFSLAGAKEFCDRLDKLKPKNIIIIGIEMHICVLQSALDLLDEGFNVFVAADCVSSRKRFDKEVALGRLQAKGVELLTVEAALFQLLGSMENPDFRKISKLIK